MRPLSVHLRGILRYDDLHLDLRDIGPGLVAITGANGEGKTTLLESLAPLPLWLDFPSRPRPLVDYCTRKDSAIETEIEWRGHVWRHVVQVDPTLASPRTEAFLFRDGLVDPDHPTPGRLRDYEQAIAAIYPSRDVFMASAFSAQFGRGEFFSLSTAARRDLFTELLGNGHLQELAERAGEGRELCDRDVIDLEEQIRKLEATTTQLEEVEREILTRGTAALDAQHEEEDRAITWRTADAARGRLAHALAEASTRYDAWSKRVADLRKSLAERRTEQENQVRREADLARKAAEVEALRDALADRDAELALVAGGEAAHAAAKADEGRVAALLETARERLDLAEKGRAALPKIDERIAMLERQNAEAAKVRPLADIDADLVRVGTAYSKVASAPNDLARVEQEAQRARVDAALVEEVPCGGHVLRGEHGVEIDCGGCPLLKNAVTAQGKVAELDAREKTLQAEALEAGRLFTERAALDGEHDLATTTATATGERLERIAELRRKRGEASTAAENYEGKVAEVARLEAEATTIAARVTTTATGAASATKATTARDEARVRLREREDAAAQLPEVRLRLEGVNDTIELQAETLRELEEEPVPDPVELRAQHETAVTAAAAAEADLLSARSRAQAARESLAALRGRADTLREQTGGVEGLRATRQAQALRRAGYRLLERGFGRDGLQALEIDAVGPAIGDLVNELLQATFGGRFRCALQTVRPAEGARKAREVFDMLIFDGDRDPKPRRIEDVSGGERVLFSEALKCAIALENARRHGLEVATLWRDECDGALSPAMAARYPSMLRRAQELGGFRNVYCVTHRESVAEQADTVIRVEGGRAVVETLR